MHAFRRPLDQPQAAGCRTGPVRTGPAPPRAPDAIHARPAPRRAQAGRKAGGVVPAVPRHIHAVQAPKSQVGGVAPAAGGRCSGWQLEGGSGRKGPRINSWRVAPGLAPGRSGAGGGSGVTAARAVHALAGAAAAHACSHQPPQPASPCVKIVRLAALVVGGGPRFDLRRALRRPRLPLQPHLQAGRRAGRGLEGVCDMGGAAGASNRAGTAGDVQGPGWCAHREAASPAAGQAQPAHLLLPLALPLPPPLLLLRTPPPLLPALLAALPLPLLLLLLPPLLAAPPAAAVGRAGAGAAAAPLLPAACGVARSLPLYPRCCGGGGPPARLPTAALPL